MMQIEFQPSGYSRGSYLNVGISFLWEASKGLNETLAFSYGYRVMVEGKQFTGYEGNDEEFYNHCAETILPAIATRESAQNMVLEMIKRRRDYFNRKPSYKKMNKADFCISNISPHEP